MEFDPATYDRAVETVRSCLAEAPGHVAQMRSAAGAAANGSGVPAPVGGAMLSAADTIAGIADQILTTVGELLEGIAAPLTMAGYAWRWTDVRGAASDVQGILRVDQLPVRGHWKGPAADRYAGATAAQSGAAARIAAMALTTTVALLACAGAGMLFYVVLGAILVRLVASLVAAVAAFASEVFSWAGLLLVVEEAGVTAAVVTGAVSALTAVLAAQVTTMTGLHGELVDHSQFPAGRWPRAVAATYSDATVTDGDAKWSVVP